MVQKPVNGSQQPTIRRGHPMPIYARLVVACQAMRENTPKALWQGAEKGFSGGKRALKRRVISSFRRRPESRAFLNYLIFKAKHWTPTFVGVTAPRGFYCKVGTSILFITLLGPKR
ncbi:MAG: hypothetical protein ABSC04_05905 [Syntrophobacteraceae bacterium]|jgi:hypothetical protein